MGRTPTISRDRLLDLAEDLVRAGGPGALTIGALAEVAGISKGGVQYAFASKDALVRALIDRWTAQFEALIDTGGSERAFDFVLAYIAATRVSQQAMNAKMAALLVSYLEDPANRQEIRSWYQGIFARLAGEGPEAQATRVAFLAVEGLFLMRINGIDADGTWLDLLDDVEAILRRLAS